MTNDTLPTRWPIRVSPNRRYLSQADGTPWFYLADTAWQLLAPTSDPEVRKTEPWCTSLEQMRLYMDDRAGRGFSAIHCRLLNEFRHDRPETAILEPDEAFFDRCIEYVRYARSKNLAMQLIPAWMGARGSRWWGVFKSLSEDNIRGFVRYLARKFAEFDNIIWSIGGDFGPPDAHAVRVCRWMGEELDQHSRMLVTFFPQGDHSSSEWFHADAWLDFNFIEVKGPNASAQVTRIITDYHKRPTKPTHLGEGAYEYELSGQRWPKVTAYQIRRSAWMTVLAGGFGYTYGRRGLWAFNDTSEGMKVPYPVHKPWEDLLSPEMSPGAVGACRMAEILRSLAWHKLVPDHAQPFANAAKDRTTLDFTISAAADDGSFGIAYFPVPEATTIDLTRLDADTITATWLDPQTGERLGSSRHPCGATTFTPPPAAKNADPDRLLLLQP